MNFGTFIKTTFAVSLLSSSSSLYPPDHTFQSKISSSVHRVANEAASGQPSMANTLLTCVLRGDAKINRYMVAKDQQWFGLGFMYFSHLLVIPPKADTDIKEYSLFFLLFIRYSIYYFCGCGAYEKRLKDINLTENQSK